MSKKKTQEWLSFVEDGQKWMLCKHCQSEYVQADEGTVAVTCSSCIIKKTLALKPLDEFFAKKRISTGRPAGWHFMNEYVDKDGNVFHKGKEQPELKGTLKPTKVKPPKKRKKLSKDEKLFKRAARYKNKLKAKRKSK